MKTISHKKRSKLLLLILFMSGFILNMTKITLFLHFTFLLLKQNTIHKKKSIIILNITKTIRTKRDSCIIRILNIGVGNLLNIF